MKFFCPECFEVYRLDMTAELVPESCATHDIMVKPESLEDELILINPASWYRPNAPEAS